MSLKTLDLASLQRLRDQNPAWRLLTAAHAPLVVSFLHQAFIASNRRTESQQSLALRLEDHLHAAREQGVDVPRAAEAYLDEWASDANGWLRKFYPAGSDEAHFDLTPAAERGIQWIAKLLERRFVGTQSRLLTVFQLLTDMVEGSEVDPSTRVADLQRRKAQIEIEMEEIRGGRLVPMDAPALRERFQQMESTARELLADFRELEQSFHALDRNVRQRIAAWEGGRGELLDDILGERDAITASDQGTSFRAFWDFLMSPERQEELTRKLDRVFQLPAIEALAPNPRLRRIHYDWLEAGEVTQRTVAKLSEQLRRYLDDRAYLENRRIMEVIREIERVALSVKEAPPSGAVATIDGMAPEVALPLERPLFKPRFESRLSTEVLLADEEVSADELFEQVAVDRERLRSNVCEALRRRDRVSLAELLEKYPLQHGLAELVAYFAVASEDGRALVEEVASQRVEWHDRRGDGRAAEVPLVIFTRPST